MNSFVGEERRRYQVLLRQRFDIQTQAGRSARRHTPHIGFETDFSSPMAGSWGKTVLATLYLSESPILLEKSCFVFFFG